MRILIVEDEPKLAALVARPARGGHAADVTGLGKDALWMAESAPYDAIVLDVMLPDLDGFEVLGRLRSKRVDPGADADGARPQSPTASRVSTRARTTT